MSSEQEDIPADLSELIRYGTVVSVDKAARRCIVQYGDPDDEDGGAETPPIRWIAGRCGKRKDWSPPSDGEQVILLVPDGQIAAAIALCGVDQDAFPLPGDEPGDVSVFDDGAKIGYDQETHILRAILPAGGTAMIEAPGGVTIKGDVTIEGNVYVSGTVAADTDVTAAGISLKSHTHPETGSQTGAPS